MFGERAAPKAADFFPAMFPTPTKGNGQLRPNNLRTGDRQPDVATSPRRKLSCRICGFLCDTSRQVASGGDLEGNGAYASNVLSGASATGDLVGAGDLSAGAGCPLCGSKNFASSSRAGQMNQEA